MLEYRDEDVSVLPMCDILNRMKRYLLSGVECNFCFIGTNVF